MAKPIGWRNKTIKDHIDHVKAGKGIKSRVKMRFDVRGPKGGLLESGKVVSLDDAFAKKLIENRQAVPYDKESAARIVTVDGVEMTWGDWIKRKKTQSKNVPTPPPTEPAGTRLSGVDVLKQYGKPLSIFKIQTDMWHFDRELSGQIGTGERPSYIYEIIWTPTEEALRLQYLFNEHPEEPFEKWSIPYKTSIDDLYNEGGKLPIVVQAYNNEGLPVKFQEGRHRLLLAKKLGMATVPILKAYATEGSTAWRDL